MSAICWLNDFYLTIIQRHLFFTLDKKIYFYEELTVFCIYIVENNTYNRNIRNKYTKIKFCYI